MTKNSKQVWEVGESREGRLALAARNWQGADSRGYMPDAYRLVDLKGQKQYRFVPHNGLERLS